MTFPSGKWYSDAGTVLELFSGSLNGHGHPGHVLHTEDRVACPGQRDRSHENTRSRAHRGHTSSRAMPLRWPPGSAAIMFRIAPLPVCKPRCSVWRARRIEWFVRGCAQVALSLAGVDRRGRWGLLLGRCRVRSGVDRIRRIRRNLCIGWYRGHRLARRHGRTPRINPGTMCNGRFDRPAAMRCKRPPQEADADADDKCHRSNHRGLSTTYQHVRMRCRESRNYA